MASGSEALSSDTACTSKSTRSGSKSKAVEKQKKYQTLPKPVYCEWTSDDGSLCGSGFTDVLTFCSHVKEHCENCVVSTPFTCCWSGCDFTARTRDTIIQHILFHPFHAYLKLLGAELQAKFKHPACQMDDRYKNVVPPIPELLKCLWNDGKCNTEFESSGEFFSHVHQHVMEQDSQSCQCRWKGMCTCMYMYLE